MRSLRAVLALSLVTTCASVAVPHRRGVIVKAGAALAAFHLSHAGASATELVLPKTGGTVVYAGEEVMAPKTHGTTEKAVMSNLKWNVDRKNADRICSFNRHYAEYAGYFKTTNYLKEVSRTEPTVYYDSVTGKPLFVAPIGRTFEAFMQESDVHGWPSFRDEEVVWENMRVLDTTGEAISVDGTHLGHNLPDRKGNRYCINLISVAGRPADA